MNFQKVGKSLEGNLVNNPYNERMNGLHLHKYDQHSRVGGSKHWTPILSFGRDTVDAYYQSPAIYSKKDLIYDSAD